MNAHFQRLESVSSWKRCVDPFISCEWWRYHFKRRRIMCVRQNEIRDEEEKKPNKHTALKSFKNRNGWPLLSKCQHFIMAKCLNYNTKRTTIKQYDKSVNLEIIISKRRLNETENDKQTENIPWKCGAFGYVTKAIEKQTTTKSKWQHSFQKHKTKRKRAKKKLVESTHMLCRPFISMIHIHPLFTSSPMSLWCVMLSCVDDPPPPISLYCYSTILVAQVDREWHAAVKLSLIIKRIYSVNLIRLFAVLAWTKLWTQLWSMAEYETKQPRIKMPRLLDDV